MFSRLFKPFPAKQFFSNDTCSCFEVPSVLDLYSGNCAVAKQLVKHGAPWVFTFDWKRGCEEDLLNEELTEELFSFAEQEVFSAFGMAPICASMSRAITPPVRSRRWPKGVPHMPGSMKQKVKEGNIHAQFCLSLIMLAIANRWAFWCENPDKSFIWLQRGWQDFLLPSSLDVFRLSWRKDTRVATNTALAGLRML